MRHTPDELSYAVIYMKRYAEAWFTEHKSARMATRWADLLECVTEVAGVLADLGREEAQRGLPLNLQPDREALLMHTTQPPQSLVMNMAITLEELTDVLGRLKFEKPFDRTRAMHCLAQAAAATYQADLWLRQALWEVAHDTAAQPPA